MSHRSIGIVGARTLPDSYRDQIREVVSYLVQRDYRIHTGGAIGADQYVLESVISLGVIDRAMIFSAWATVHGFPRAVQRYVEYFVSHRGRISWGIVKPGSSRAFAIAGLLARNQRLVRGSHGIIAFMYGESRGTLRTIREAIRLDRRVVVFLCGDGAVLPEVEGSWIQLRCGCFAGAYLYKR